MSDSDSELLSNNAFPFRNESLAVSVRGPSVNMDLTGFNFRNNVPSSTMHTSSYDWQRPPESSYSQRRMGYRRETSPMSTISACDARQRHFNNFFARGMSSQRSVMNGRGTSPMSVRSIASNTTRASEVNMTIEQFKLMDRTVLKEAYTKYMKNNKRRRIEKRRKLWSLRKPKRRKSGYDSGELGSNSSNSSDDNSLRNHRNMSSCRSTYTDISNFRSKIKERNTLTEYTNNSNCNGAWNMAREQENNTMQSSSRNMMVNTRRPLPATAMFNNTAAQSTMTLKDRFRNRFQLPSQRFNSTVPSSIPEVSENPSEIINRQLHTQARLEPSNQQDVSSEEEIFSEITAIERPKNQRKRSCDDDTLSSIKKRVKISSPYNKLKKPFKESTEIKNDFEFTKPALPVKKSANPKVKEKISNPTNILASPEKLIAKSAAPLCDNILQAALPVISITSQPNTVDEIVSDQTTLQNTNVSMRPSFIKRKLFTQKMDVAENNNDIFAENSPQNSIYGAILKEKHKARKLATSQYCLSRDIQPENNNVILDLIHKIVPAQEMNATTQPNRTVVQNNTNNKSVCEGDKWDVSSIVLSRNNDKNDSDTFTDEEILTDKNRESPKIVKKTIKNSAPNVQAPQKVIIEKNGTSTKPVQTSLKSFWDTDFESTDDEAMKKPASQKTNLKENQRIDNLDKTTAPKVQGFSGMFPLNKTTSLRPNVSVMDSTSTSILKFNNSSRSFKLFSHRSVCKPIPKKVTEKKDDAITQIELETKKQQTMRANRKCDISILEKENAHTKEKPEKDQLTQQPENAMPQNKKKTQKDQLIPQTKPGNKNTPQKKQKTRKINDNTPKVRKTTKKPLEENRKQANKKTDNILHKPLSNEKSEKQTNKKTDNILHKPLTNEKSKKQTNKKIDNTLHKLSNEKSENNDHIEPHKKVLVAVQNKTQIDEKNESIKLQNKKATATKNKTLTSNNSDVKRQYKNKTVCVQNNSISKINTRNKANASKLSDSMIYEDSFSGTNSNKSIRPIRTCRVLKQNETISSNGLNMTLRSRSKENITITNEEQKPSERNNKKYKENKKVIMNQSDKSDFSFSLVSDKKAVNKKQTNLVNSRLFKTKAIDTSDVSFSLPIDKDTPLTKRGNSARNKLTEVKIMLSPLKNNKINMYSKRSVKPNRRYVN